MPKDVVDDVQGKIDAVKKALEGTDMGRIRTAKDELESHMQHIGEAMAKAAGAHAGAGAAHTEETPHAHQDSASGFGGGSQGHSQQSHKNDNIEEAEVEIIDDEKKK